MVGTLGETELSAVGVGIQPYFIYWMMMFGFVSGSATFMSQFWGTKDLANIKKTLGFAVAVCMSLGLLFFAACAFFPEYIVNIFTDIEEIKPLAIDYIRIGAPCFLLMCITVPITFCLRTTQQTKIPLYTSTFAFTMNTFFNYVLIFGNFGAPRLGVTGAAAASVLARSLELLVVLVVVFYKKNIISGKIKEYFGWNKEFSGRIVKNSIPTTLNETLWGTGFALYTAIYARVGITAFAAVQVGRVIENLFVMAAYSIGDAALILVGQRLGAGETAYGYKLAVKLLKIGAVISVVGGLVLIGVSKPLLGLFNFTDEGEQYAFYILIVYGLTMSVVVFNGTTVVGVLRSGGDTKYAMLVDCSCLWLIGVPVAYVAALWFSIPIYYVILLARMEEVVKFFILVSRVKSKKWVKNVIKGL